MKHILLFKKKGIFAYGHSHSTSKIILHNRKTKYMLIHVKLYIKAGSVYIFERFTIPIGLFTCIFIWIHARIHSSIERCAHNIIPIHIIIFDGTATYIEQMTKNEIFQNSKFFTLEAPKRWRCYSWTSPTELPVPPPPGNRYDWWWCYILMSHPTLL